MDVLQAFYAYAMDERNSISIFDCKCALIKSLGVEIPVKRIAAILQSHCSWKRDGGGINMKQWESLHSYVFQEQCPHRTMNYYYKFDQRRRGWITEDDVFRVRNSLESTEQL